MKTKAERGQPIRCKGFSVQPLFFPCLSVSFSPSAAYKVEGYPGRFSGTETHSQVRIRTSWRDDGTYIECEAFNPKMGAPTLNDRIKLNVTFAPKFSPLGDIPPGDFASRAVQEGTNMTLEMGVRANPKPTEYTWLFGDEPFAGNSRVLPIQGKLILKSVRRRDAGNYTLIVANKQGRSSLKFFLNVTCKSSLQSLGKAKATNFEMGKNFNSLKAKFTAVSRGLDFNLCEDHFFKAKPVFGNRQELVIKGSFRFMLL